MKKIALITGASSGIGKALALQMAKSKAYKLILCGRNETNLQEVLTACLEYTEAISLLFEVGDRTAVQKAIEQLPLEWQSVSVLINNAGNAHGLGPIQENQFTDWQAMIQSNVMGLLYVTEALLPQLIAMQGADIVNISSIAGKETYPNGAVYCASKSAVESLSEGMRMDLFKHQIRVMNIAPGMVETNFSLVRFKGDEERAATVYKGVEALQADDIAETILWMLSRPRRVNIADVLILPSAQASATLVNRG